MFDYDKASKDFQKVGQESYDALLQSYGEMNRGFQTIGAEMTGYTKQAFADATRTLERLVGARSLEQVIEIQSQYAKSAYDSWVSEATKVSEMCVNTARDAYRPVEKAVAKTVPSAA